MRNIVRSMAVLLALLGFAFYFNSPQIDAELASDVDDEGTNEHRNNRKPASWVGLDSSSEFKRVESKVSVSNSSGNTYSQNPDLSQENDVQDTPASSGIVNRGYRIIFEEYSHGGRNYVAGHDAGPVVNKDSASVIPGANLQTFVGGAPRPALNAGPVSNDSQDEARSSPQEPNSAADVLICSSNIGGGTYGNPIQVTLSCSASADIKYCFQQGSCCDPESSGTSYTSALVIGQADGNYCLSFMGESATNKVSSVVEHSYNINTTYPDLQVSFAQTFYQTTQLEGSHFVRSKNFSALNFTAGQINLKSHDPGPSGLNMDCEDLVQNYAGLPAPVPEEMFAPMDLADIQYGNEIKVPLAASKLSYGDNFLTSFIVNNNPSGAFYSCSTNKVVLQEFEFFAAEVSFAQVGTNEGTEYAGSFMSYSFFEEEAQVHRTPAGEAQSEQGDQELRVGSFGIFY